MIEQLLKDYLDDTGTYAPKCISNIEIQGSVVMFDEIEYSYKEQHRVDLLDILAWLHNNNKQENT